MSEKDKITELFRNRLSDAEMPVRDGFWEALQHDLPAAPVKGSKWLVLSPKFYRAAAAASVIFVLGAASAAFWYFSPKEEIKEAFTQVAAIAPEGNLNGDRVQESLPSIASATPVTQTPVVKQSANGPQAVVAAQEEEEESVYVSFTFTQRIYSNVQSSDNGSYSNTTSMQQGNYHSNSYYTNGNSGRENADNSADGTLRDETVAVPKPRNWAIKAAVGTSLPKGDYNMPFTAGVMVERRLNKHLSLEAGLQYNCLDGDHTLHTLGVPVKLNVLLANSSKVDFYAMVGGAAEKCIAGAPDNGFNAEPIQLSVLAGVGIRYKMSDRFALFAEPSVSHHFDTDSQTKTIRTERATNMNLLCGVRMTY